MTLSNRLDIPPPPPNPLSHPSVLTLERLTYAGPEGRLPLLVSWGAAVAPKPGHALPAQTLTRRLVAPVAHRSQRMALARWEGQGQVETEQDRAC